MTLVHREPFPIAPVLSPDDVHVVWFAHVPASDASWLALLDADERARMVRLRDERHRGLFLTAHATVRVVLGRCLGIPPADVRLGSGPHGKPELVDASADVRFSLAHAGELGLIAVGTGRSLGIDLEEVRPVDAMVLARQFFSTAERDALASRSIDDRLNAFYRCWVRKESFVKATGHGLTRALASFDMSLDDTGATMLLADREDTGGPARWTTRALAAGEGYVGAMTVEGRGWRLHEWRAP